MVSNSMNDLCGIESKGISPRWGFSPDFCANPGLLARAIESRPLWGFSARLRGSTKVAGARRPQGPAAGASHHSGERRGARGAGLLFARAALRLSSITRNLHPPIHEKWTCPQQHVWRRARDNHNPTRERGGDPSPASTRPSLPR
jgi:hypothetical protein